MIRRGDESYFVDENVRLAKSDHSRYAINQSFAVRNVCKEKHLRIVRVIYIALFERTVFENTNRIGSA